MTNAAPNLNPADLTGLEVVSNPRDLHQDLLIFLDFVGERSIKRSMRDNSLPKSETKDLAKRLGLPWPDTGPNAPSTAWIAHLDFLAWAMHLTSSEALSRQSQSIYESYESYLVLNQKNASTFTSRTPLQQEHIIRAALVKMPLKIHNELFDPTPLGRLDTFGDWQKTTSTAPQASFEEAREALLDVLARLPGGQWFRVDSLVEHLKRESPYFLLPKNAELSGRGQPKGRYSGFLESRGSGMWGSSAIVHTDPDAFERVEGRFIERFLETLPLQLRYVELAYHPGPYTGLYPTRGLLRAFRVNDRFLHLMLGKTPPPQVTVQPNFEVVIVSEVYPAAVIKSIGPLGVVTSSSVGQAGPSVITVRLKRERVAAVVAGDERFDPVDALQKASGRAVAQNVAAELREWAAQSDVFTLYQGFTLLETQDAVPGLSEKATMAEIGPGLSVVKLTADDLRAMREKGAIYLTAAHAPDELTILPDGAVTRFATPSNPFVVEAKIQPLAIRREEKVTLHLTGASREAFEAVKAAFLALNVPVESDEKAMRLTYPLADDPLLQEVIRALADRFSITIKP